MKKIKYLVLLVALFLTSNVFAQGGTLDNDNIQGTILRQEIENGARLISTGVPLC